MVQKLSKTEISSVEIASVPDSSHWNSFALDQGREQIMQSYQWARVSRLMGWRPFCISMTQGESIKATALALHRSAFGLPIGGLLSIPRGPILDFAASDGLEVFSKMLDYLQWMAKRRFAVLRISPDVSRENSWISDLLHSKGFEPTTKKTQHHCTFRIDLTRPLSDILAGLDKSKKKWIRRFDNSSQGLRFTVEQTPKGALDSFYPLYKEALVRAGESYLPYKTMRSMHETLSKSSSSFICLMQREDEVLAGAFVLAFGQKIWQFYSGSKRRSGFLNGAKVFLTWELIKWAKATGFSEYDQQGVPCDITESDPRYGIFKFKRGWGGNFVRLIGDFEYAPFPLLKRLLYLRLST